MRAPGLVVVLVLLTGCGLPLLRDVRPSVDRQLSEAEAASRAGHYRRAEAAYRAILESGAPATAVEQALLGLGRLSVAADNPDRDDRKAYRYFDRLVTEHPTGRLAPEARTWRALVAAVLAQQDEMRLLRREAARLRHEAQRERQDAGRIREDLERLKRRELELERDRLPTR